MWVYLHSCTSEFWCSRALEHWVQLTGGYISCSHMSLGISEFLCSRGMLHQDQFGVEVHLILLYLHSGAVGLGNTRVN